MERVVQPRLHHEEELANARRAITAKLYKACILHCLLAIEAFISDILWGKMDVEVIYPPSTTLQPLSSLDLVFDFVRPRRGGPDYPPDYKLQCEVNHQHLKPYLQEFRKANKKLFRNGSDGLLLRQAAKTGVLIEDDVRLVTTLRSLRDFCCHFNPYSVTLVNYEEALKQIGVEFEEFRELPRVASKVLEEAEKLLTAWNQREMVKAEPRSGN